jgi:hypothetical protein
MNTYPINSRKTQFFIIAFFLVAAACIRAPGLGKWCLSEDEYYFSQPIAFILEKGVPQYPSGGYYNRGYGLQYLTALPALIFKDWEFAVRILPLLFGVMTVPLFFLLASRFLGTVPAILCSCMLLFSSWHIEFSRFARFYAPFQFIFLLFVYSLHEGYITGKTGKKEYRILAFVLCLFSVSIDRYSIFLPLILLSLVFLLDGVDAKTALSLFLQAGMLVFINLEYSSFDFGRLEVVGPTLPPASDFERSSPIIYPNFGLLRSIPESAIALVGYLMLLVAAGYLFRKSILKFGNFWDKIALVLSLSLPLLHQYGLLVFLSFLLLINKRTVQAMFLENVYSWCLYLGGTLAYWAGVAYLSENFDKILFFTVGYPPIKHAILVPFRDTVPILGAFLMFVVILSTVHHLAREQLPNQRFLVSLVIVLLFVMPFFNTPQKSTRYIYFFFPLILILAYAEAASLSEWMEISFPSERRSIVSAAILLIPILLYTATEDFHVRHILGVSSAQMNYRMGEYDRYSRHWYPRADFEEPSRYVNRVFSEGDVIIVDHVGMTRHLDKPYVFYVHHKEPERYPYHATKGGKVEKWTAKPLLSRPEELAELVPAAPNRSLWLITSLAKDRVGSSFMGTYHNVQSITKQFNLHAALVFKGLDGRIGVWKITRPPETLLRNAGQMGGKS